MFISRTSIHIVCVFITDKHDSQATETLLPAIIVYRKKKGSRNYTCVHMKRGLFTTNTRDIAYKDNGEPPCKKFILLFSYVHFFNIPY